MQKHIHQKGSAIIIVLVTVIVILLVALGWALWNNFNDKDQKPGTKSEVSSKTDTKTNPVDAIPYEKYENQILTFDSNKVWNIVEGIKQPRAGIVTITSPDYKKGSSETPKAGSYIGIYLNKVDKKNVKDRMIALKKLSYVSDVKKATISGEKAYTYTSDYQGHALVADVQYKKAAYQIEMKGSDKTFTDIEKATFMHLVETLAFK